MFVQRGFAGMSPATRLADYPNQLPGSGLEDVRYQLLSHQSSSQVFTNLLVCFSHLKSFFFSIQSTPMKSNFPVCSIHTTLVRSSLAQS